MAGNNKMLVEALDALTVEGFKMGSAWSRLHDLCQAHEGEAEFDRAHALCHRIEGDDWNADYWYRRSGHARGTGSVAEECAAMKADLTA